MRDIDLPTTHKLQLLTQISDQKPYQAFLYDCDGTLADNMHAHKGAYKKAAKKYGIDLDTSIVDELAGWPTVQVATEISKRYNVPLDAEQLGSEKSTIFFDEYIEDTLPIEFVVKHLKNHLGKVRIGVVSGGRRATVTKSLSVLGIIDDIEILVCAGETDLGKPHPDPFLLAAQQLGIHPSHCLVFEDGNPGVQSATAAGMDWVRVDQIGEKLSSRTVYQSSK